MFKNRFIKTKMTQRNAQSRMNTENDFPADNF